MSATRLYRIVRIDIEGALVLDYVNGPANPTPADRVALMQSVAPQLTEANGYRVDGATIVDGASATVRYSAEALGRPD